MRKLPDLVLTLGVDGSGKSSFMNKIASELGYLALEPTGSDEAKAFKAQHFNDPMDIALVRQRRNLFRDLNVVFDGQVREKLKEHRVITTGHRLVTEISHAVMGKLVGNEDYSLSQIIEDWRAGTPLVPDEIILTYAPMGVIRNRLQQRLANGQIAEQMTGFNSLSFLSRYQEVLGATTQLLDIPVLSGDTSVVSVEAGLQRFVA